MKKLLFLIPLFLIAPIAYGEVSIQNDQKYVDSDGLLHIVGEIENNTSTPLNQIKISAILVDNNGNEVKKYCRRNCFKYHNAIFLITPGNLKYQNLAKFGQSLFNLCSQ